MFATGSAGLIFMIHYFRERPVGGGPEVHRGVQKVVGGVPKVGGRSAGSGNKECQKSVEGVQKVSRRRAESG